jgi:hypothetical protein
MPPGITEGKQDLTPEQIVAIFRAGFDVMLTHSSDEEPVLYVDDPGKRFTQR